MYTSFKRGKMTVQVYNLIEEARKFLNYDRSTRMAKGRKSNRVSLVERLANEVERQSKENLALKAKIKSLEDAHLR